MTSLQLPGVRSTSISCFKGIKQSDRQQPLCPALQLGEGVSPALTGLQSCTASATSVNNASYLSTP